MTVKQRVSKLEKQVATVAEGPAGKTRIVQVPRGTRAEQEAFMANYPPFEVSDAERADLPGDFHLGTFFAVSVSTDAPHAGKYPQLRRPYYVAAVPRGHESKAGGAPAERTIFMRRTVIQTARGAEEC
jgi:hypothetical protein